MTRETLDRLVLIGFIVLAVLLYLSTASYTGIAKETSAKYVRFLAVSFGTLALVQLARSLWARPSGVPLDLFGRATQFFGLLAGLILFAMSLKSLGFFIPAAVFIPLVAVMLGYRNVLAIAVSTGLVLLAVYLIFVLLLSVDLPGPELF